MPQSSTYKARNANAEGYIHYPEADHQVWHTLITRQLATLPNRACDAYLDGLQQLALPEDRIPQLAEINRVLEQRSGWQVAAVPALISFDHFFALLAKRQFPVATFIRTTQDIDYIQEPDIFHEIFGHCPMLTHPGFAEFTHTYGCLGAKASPQDRAFLARLYWLTVEFGLVDSPQGISIYGGGILSSYTETRYCLTPQPLHRPFTVLDALRTPYRIDILQPLYYVIDRIETLYQLTQIDLMTKVEQAKRLGLFAPSFEAAKVNESAH
ncbi:MAG: phenylalanine 4-monooxygenase [Halopseudomonas sp.]